MQLGCIVQENLDVAGVHVHISGRLANVPVHVAQSGCTAPIDRCLP